MSGCESSLPRSSISREGPQSDLRLNLAWNSTFFRDSPLPPLVAKGVADLAADRKQSVKEVWDEVSPTCLHPSFLSEICHGLFALTLLCSPGLEQIYLTNNTLVPVVGQEPVCEFFSFQFWLSAWFLSVGGDLTDIGAPQLAMHDENRHVRAGTLKTPPYVYLLLRPLHVLFLSSLMPLTSPTLFTSQRSIPGSPFVLLSPRPPTFFSLTFDPLLYFAIQNMHALQTLYAAGGTEVDGLIVAWPFDAVVQAASERTFGAGAFYQVGALVPPASASSSAAEESRREEVEQRQGVMGFLDRCADKEVLFISSVPYSAFLVSLFCLSSRTDIPLPPCFGPLACLGLDPSSSLPRPTKPASSSTRSSRPGPNSSSSRALLSLLLSRLCARFSSLPPPLMGRGRDREGTGGSNKDGSINSVSPLS